MLIQPYNPAMRTRPRATALIIRPDPIPALLVYFHPDITRGLYCLGGGIDPDEDPFVCVCREIHEECGLDASALTFVRKLDVIRYCKPRIALNVERHDFVFLAPPGLPKQWSHVITLSKDEDNGLTHRMEWVTRADLARVHPEFQDRITPEWLPELFQC